MCKLFRAVSILILLMLAQLLSEESRAQPQNLSGQISGQVRYAGVGGQPAFNVIVKCDSFNGGSCGEVMTDRSGRFRFTGLAPSQYNITIRVPGYIEQTQTVELLTSPSAYLQFQLKSDDSAKAPVARPGVVHSSVPSAATKEFDQAAAALATQKKEGLEQAVKHLEKAISLYPQYVQAKLALGTTYMDLGQFDKAEQALRQTVELEPKAANALFALGELYKRQKKVEDAEKTLLQGLVIEDRSFQGHLALARVYLDMASKQKAEPEARPFLEKAYAQVNQSAKLKPDFAEAHLVKGNLLLRVRRAADAQHEFEEYLRLDPKGPFADQTRTVVEKIKKALESEKKP
jgi:tetratricopeptide (TPR) repeat protein